MTIVCRSHFDTLIISIDPSNLYKKVDFWVLYLIELVIKIKEAIYYTILLFSTGVDMLLIRRFSRFLICIGLGATLAVLGACEGTEGEKGDKGDKGDTGPQGDGQGAAILVSDSAANFIGYVTGSDLEDEQVLQTVTADGYILRLESLAIIMRLVNHQD